MAYTPIPTKSTGDTWAHTDHNTYWRDNMAAGVPDIFTTKGDIAAATGADAATRRPVGANGSYLFVDSSKSDGLYWKARGYYISRHKIAAAPAIADSTATIINFATESFDPGSAVTTGAAWKYTAPLTGYYHVAASVLCQASANWAENEDAYLAAYVDDSPVSYLCHFFACAAASGGYGIGMSGSTVVYMAATSFVDVRIYQTSGANLTITNDPDACWVSVALMQYAP